VKRIVCRTDFGVFGCVFVGSQFHSRRPPLFWLPSPRTEVMKISISSSFTRGGTVGGGFQPKGGRYDTGSSLQDLIVGHGFNQSMERETLPNSLQRQTFFQ